jgi:hypothetical protein
LVVLVTIKGYLPLIQINVREYHRKIKKGPSRETGNIDKEKEKMLLDTTIQSVTNSVNKTCTLLQTTGGKDEPKIDFMRKS